MHIKTMWIKDEYLQLILDGRKTVEIRVGYDNIKRLQPGDHLQIAEKPYPNPCEPGQNLWP